MFNEKDIGKAVEVVSRGGVILYPTDTIWGLGCDATNEEAVRRISRIKNRPEKKSYIVLMGSVEMLRRYGGDIPENTVPEMTAAPRPTTFILPGIWALAPSLVQEDGTLGVRIPADPFCRELIRRTGVPLVSTSANFTGEPPPAHFAEIPPALIKLVDYVVRWRQDDLAPSRPSRIVKILPGGGREVLRP